MGIPFSGSTSGLCREQVVALGAWLQVWCCERRGFSVRVEVVIDSRYLGWNRNGTGMADVQEMMLLIQVSNQNKTPVR